jgi:hypothetical protein
VRAQVSRLRAKLEEYYTTIGAEDEIIIDMPKRGLGLTFQKRKLSAEVPSRRWLRLGFVLTALNLIVAVVIFWTAHASRPAGAPTAVLPWSAIFSSPNSTHLITSDPNIVEIQGFTGGQISVSDYANHNYIPEPNTLTPEINRFCRDILRGDKAAAVDTVIAVNIAQMAQASSRKIKVHSARNIQLSELKTDDNLIFWEARVQTRGLPFSAISWTSGLSLTRIRGRRSFAMFIRARMSYRRTSRRLRVGLRGNRSPSLLLLKIPIKTGMFSSWQVRTVKAPRRLEDSSRTWLVFRTCCRNVVSLLLVHSNTSSCCCT